jgi:hypothetical protein
LAEGAALFRPTGRFAAIGLRRLALRSGSGAHRCIDGGAAQCVTHGRVAEGDDEGEGVTPEHLHEPGFVPASDGGASGDDQRFSWAAQSLGFDQDVPLPERLDRDARRQQTAETVETRCPAPSGSGSAACMSRK